MMIFVRDYDNVYQRLLHGYGELSWRFPIEEWGALYWQGECFWLALILSMAPWIVILFLGLFWRDGMIVATT